MVNSSDDKGKIIIVLACKHSQLCFEGTLCAQEDVKIHLLVFRRLGKMSFCFEVTLCA